MHALFLMMGLFSGSQAGPSLSALAQQVVQATAPADVQARVTLAASRFPRGCRVTGAKPANSRATSGLVPLQVWGALPTGAPCSGVQWCTVELLKEQWVTARQVARGASLAGAVERAWVPLQPATLDVDPADLVAARSLNAGTALTPAHVRLNLPALGTHVPVQLRQGGLEVTTQGTLVGCTALMACARVSNGQTVQGPWRRGALWLGEQP